jgi:hypothetical protein
MDYDTAFRRRVLERLKSGPIEVGACTLSTIGTNVEPPENRCGGTVMFVPV